MQLRWVTLAPTSRDDLGDYVRELRIDVLCWDEPIEQEYLVARLSVDQILWADATRDGESLFAICDNDSQGLHELHVILTDGTNEIRDDLQVDEYVESVVFVHEALFHPDVYQFRVPALDAVYMLFGPFSLAVMWEDVGGVPVADQVQLGLARVAGSGLVFRHNAVPTPYSQQHPRGLEIGFHATHEMQQWVEGEWKRLERE
jgi:hypothetical protein